MRIEYIVQARMPTEKAHGLQIAHMCAAFAELGHEVRLVVPKRANPIPEDLFSYYGVKRNFTVKYLSCVDLVSRWGRYGAVVYWAHAVLFVLRLLAHRAGKDTLVYTRSAEIAWLYKLRGYRVVCEVHDWPESSVQAFTWLLWDIDLLPCNSPGTERACLSHGLTRTMVAHNGISLKDFNVVYEKRAVRQELGLPPDAKVVMYIGSLEKWKGAETLCEAAALFAPDTITVVIGGQEPAVEKLKGRYPKVRFLGPRSYKEIAKNQTVADVLVVPNIPESKESAEYTSPIKLFAHMASGVPVVVSDLPSLRAIASEETAYFFPPGNAQLLANVVGHILTKPGEAARRALSAKEAAKQYAWPERAKRILARLPSTDRGV